MEDMGELKRAIRADSSNSRAQTKQVLNELKNKSPANKFTFNVNGQQQTPQTNAIPIQPAWNPHASTQSELDNFMERLNNVESTVSIFRQDKAYENEPTEKKKDKPAFEDDDDGLAETNTELSFC